MVLAVVIRRSRFRSGTEAVEGPLCSFGEVAEAVVEAALAALPEFEIGGGELVATPEVGAGDVVLVREAGGECGVAGFEGGADADAV